MSCGCAKGQSNPKDITEDKAETADSGTHTYDTIKPGETIECYMQRTPGEPAPSQPAPADKIATLSIPVDCEMKVNTPFKMTPESKLPVTWEMSIKDDQGKEIKPEDIGLNFDTNSGQFQGTIKPEFEKKIFTSTVKANKDGNAVDEKTYKFVGKKCDPSELRFIHPNPGARRTSPFGPRTSPTKGASKNHKGTDFSTRGKADILASADGIVTSYTGVHDGYGNIVEIAHKDASGKLLATTRYAHLSRIYVSEGQQVAAGTPIGHEGNTGIGTGPHLHFEILLAGKGHVDPEQYINGKIEIDPNSDVAPDSGTPSNDPPKVVENKNKALTAEEVDAKTNCPELTFDENKDDTTRFPGDPNDPEDKPGAPSNKQNFGKDICRPEGPEGKPSKEEVLRRVNAEIDKHPEVTADEREYMTRTIGIESTYDPYIKCSVPESSSLGLYQMNNDCAKQYYGQIGIQNPTCEQRCNIELATQAEIAKMKEDGKRVDKMRASGKYPNTAHGAKYSSLSRAEMLYLCHHDGAGSFKNGSDLRRIICF